MCAPDRPPPDDVLGDALLGLDGDEIRCLAEAALALLGRDRTAPLFFRLYFQSLNTGEPARFCDAIELGRDNEERAALLASIGWLPEGIDLRGPFVRAGDAPPARPAVIPTLKVLAGFLLYAIREAGRLGKAPPFPHVVIADRTTPPIAFTPFYRSHQPLH